jgi:uncharacterized protein YlzI (FlbEa/FlbD family)
MHRRRPLPKTHQFTKNASGTPITIVIDKIKTFEFDEFSECTQITLIDGTKYGVSETIEEVTKIVEAS